MTDNTEILEEYKDFVFDSKETKNTAVSYFSNVQRAVSEIGKNISDISEADITDYFELKKKTLKPSTIRLMRASLKDFLVFIESDIQINVKMPRVQIEAHAIPSKSDFKKILFYSGQKRGYEGLRNKTILSVLYHSGLRIDETRCLELDDIDLDERLIYVFGKGAKRRAVPINDTLYSVLSDYINVRLSVSSSKHLFVSAGKNHKGSIISYGAFRAIVKSACKDAGFSNLSPYCFRHAFCTNLIRSGASFSVVACMMGHSDTSALMAYFVPDNLDGREAVKALNF